MVLSYLNLAKKQSLRAINWLGAASQFRRNLVSGGITAACNMLLLLLSYPLYLTYLGAAWYGLWATLSVLIAMSQMGNLGLHHALARHMAHAMGRDDAQEAGKLLGAALALILPPCLIVIYASTIHAPQILALLHLEEPFFATALNILPFIGLLSALVLVSEILKGAVIGAGRMDVANYIFLAGRCVQFGLSVLLIAAGMGITGLLIGASVGYVLMSGAYLLVVLGNAHLAPSAWFGFSLAHVKLLLGFGAYMTASSIISMLMDPFNKIIITRYLGLDSVTAYEIGIKGVQAIRSVYDGIFKAIMPRVSELGGKLADSRAAIIRIHRKSAQIIAITAAPVFVGVFLTADPLLHLWLGAGFAPDMAITLRWFLIGYLINLISVPGFYALLGLGRAVDCFFAQAFSACFHILGVLVLLLVERHLNLERLVAIHNIAIIAGAFLLMTLYYRATSRMTLTSEGRR